MDTYTSFKIRLIAGGAYGILAMLVGFIAACGADGTMDTVKVSKLAIVGIIFGLLAVIELAKAEKIAKGTDDEF